MSALGTVLWVALALTAPQGGAAREPADELPSVARPTLPGSGRSYPRGVVFFLGVEGGEVFALGSAQAGVLDALSRSRRLELRIPDAGDPAAVATGFVVPPGLPWNAPLARLERAVWVFELDEAVGLRGVRVLEAERDRIPSVGEFVDIAGVGRNAGTLTGRIGKATTTRLEVDLDPPRSLAGAEGAPIVSRESGRVLGVFQTAQTRGEITTVIATPIGQVLADLAHPVPAGSDRGFAAFGDLVRLRSADGSARLDRQMRRIALPRSRPTAVGMELDVVFPADGSRVAADTCGTYVAGESSVRNTGVRQLDVVFAVDVSGSTAESTGVDLDGDGVAGRRGGSPGSLFTIEHPDTGDSVLAAETRGVRQLLRELEPDVTRVGVVAFSSATQSSGIVRWLSRRRTHARVVAPLTADFGEIERALDELLAITPSGETHIAAGLDLARIELLALSGSLSTPDPDRHKIVFLLTDGQPTAPYGPDQMARNAEAALAAAARARRGSITVHTFAIGPAALEGPVAVLEMARITGGTFTPVRHPAELADVIASVRFPELRDIAVRNLTTGGAAEQLAIGEDGRFGSLVRTVRGTNKLEIRAVDSAGRESRRVITVYGEGDVEPPVPDHLLADRAALVTRCERALAESEPAAGTLDLRVEVGRERARAERAAEAQRKQLEIEIEEAAP